jgi:hypothetical protein
MATIRQPFGNDASTETSLTSVGVGAVAGTNVSVVEYGTNDIHKTVITLTNETITITDDAGVAQYGGTKIYDFPQGLLCTLGAVIDGALTAGVTGTIIDTWNGDVALGTATATTGATLTGTEADVLQSTSTTTAVAKVGVTDAVSIATALTESGARWFDGTATAKDLYLNFVIDDDASHTTGTATFTGTVTIMWTIIGDK